jgi:hypothetical protein
VSGGTVYAGGYFTSIGGQTRTNIAALDSASGVATAWNPNAHGEVDALAVSGGTVYAGGYFTSIGGQPRNRIAALDAASGVATAWDPNADSNVDALAVSGGTVYAGGYFTSIGGYLRIYIAALDAASGAATAWDPNANDYVFALAVSGGTVYAGGGFTSIGGQSQAGVAAISADASTATLLALFEATTTSGGIELHWSFGEASRVTTVAVERALRTTGPWLPIAPELSDEGGMTVALDRTANESGEYFYRLVVRLTDGGRVVFGPVSAQHGEPLSKSDLSLLSPNPTSRGAQVHYAVARPGRVRLELLDVSGRVEGTLADGIQVPGRYEIAWDGAGRGGRLSPGLHFILLEAPDRVAVRKLAIIR